ncbi:ribonuclease-like 3 [Chaetodon trifascialis]|uniref:ribonuclease-like 3 n=1 Tax=Chaetodon trifascialis TaxID=109706 RepID=UPI003991B09A
MRTLLVCSLLVLLSAAVLSENADIKSRYKKFIHQHIYENMTANMCDNVMREKEIYVKKTNKCKKINTFILDNIKPVRAVCENQGEPDGDMTKSRRRFHIVVCTLKNRKAKYPKCHYNGTKLHKKIKIKCEKGLPVHYDGNIGHCDN